MLTKCPKCNGHVEPVKRADQTVFHFCRYCKLPFSDTGRVVIDTKHLNSSFNPTRMARIATNKSVQDISPVAKTALEALIIQSLLEAYSAGLKDGILLAYSQDVEDGKPLE